MITNDEARARVQRGAGLLDARRPDWFQQVNIGTLTLDDCTECVLGQLYGDEFKAQKNAYGFPFGLGVKRLGLESDLNNDMIRDHGFGIGDGDGDGERDGSFVRLQDAWIDAIADRRLSTAPNRTQDGDAVPVRPTVHMAVCSS